MKKKTHEFDEILLSHISKVESAFITSRAVKIIFASKFEVPNRLASPKQKLVQNNLSLRKTNTLVVDLF